MRLESAAAKARKFKGRKILVPTHTQSSGGESRLRPGESFTKAKGSNATKADTKLLPHKLKTHPPSRAPPTLGANKEPKVARGPGSKLLRKSKEHRNPSSPPHRLVQAQETP